MIKRRTIRALDLALVLIILLHWIVISSFGHWWGGFTFGPRLFTDMMPLFVLLMIPVLQSMAATDKKLGPRLLLIISFTCTLLLSIFIHHRGATEPATWMWNSVPVMVDREVARLWAWSDLQFLRGLNRDQVFIRPTHISLPPPSAEAGNQTATLSLINPNERPVVWEIQLPLRISLKGAKNDFTQTTDEYGNPLFVQNQQTQPFSQSDIKLRLKYPEEETGKQSLGGIRVRARDDTGQTRNGTLQIVPIGFSNTSGDADSALFDLLPADVSVNKAGRSNSLYATYGYGWYSLETAEQAQWRWVMSPAHLYVYSDKAGDVTISVKFAAIPAEAAPGEASQLTTSVNGTAMPAQRISLEQPMLIEAPLQAGWNQLVLQSSEGNFRPIYIDPQSGDGRLLNFAIESIELNSRENR